MMNTHESILPHLSRTYVVCDSVRLVIHIIRFSRPQHVILRVQFVREKLFYFWTHPEVGL